MLSVFVAVCPTTTVWKLKEVAENANPSTTFGCVYASATDDQRGNNQEATRASEPMKKGAS